MNEIFIKQMLLPKKELALQTMELMADKMDLQQRIDKAIDMLDLIIPELWNISNAMTYKIKEVKRVLGDKENE